MQPLPRAGALTAWFNGWVAGSLGPDDLVDWVVGDDAAHDVVGLDDQPVPLVLAGSRLRRAGADQALLVLPVPGDLTGLAGPPDLNAAAVDVGEAALFPGAGLALVPEAVGAGVFWRVHSCAAQVPITEVPATERALREALLVAADRLTTLDVARWRPEVAEALSTLRDEHDDPLPPGHHPRAARLAVLALRCSRIVGLAQDHGSAAVTAYETDVRDHALADLERASRHALAAACSQRPDPDRVRAR